VNGSSVGAVTSYTFPSVTADQTIAASFQANPPVAAITTLAATQQLTGNTPGDQTTSIALNWTATPSGTTVEIYRAAFGQYPEYDDAGGAVPVATPTYPPDNLVWTLVSGVTAPGQTDLVATRDFYYYVAYVKDAYGTWSPVSNMTAGTLNYHLGDVSDDVTPGTGNNKVFTEDISLLGSNYGITLAPFAMFNYLDVGPTTTFYVDGRPTTDNKVNFEDLVMFAINYNTVSAPAIADGRNPASGVSRDEMVLEAPTHVTAGSGATAVATLTLRGTGALRAVSTELSWNPAVVEPVGPAGGELLEMANGIALSPAPGAVDMATFGGTGLAGEGVLATVTFRVIGTGDPAIRVAAVDARDAHNQKVTVPVTQATQTATPTVTMMLAPRPNPFRGMTTFSFSLAQRGAVDLTVYSVDGRLIRTLTTGVREAGEFDIVWDGRDEYGTTAPSGIYFARLSTPSGRFTKTVTLLK
jgi:hypothetical protein